MFFSSFLVFQFFGDVDRSFQCAQLVVDLLQFALVVTLGHDACACLVKEGVSAAHEGADGDRLIEVAVESNESDTATIGAPVVGLNFGNQLHGSHFRGAAEGSCREGVGKCFDGIALRQDGSAHAGNEVNYVGVVMYLFVEIDPHVIAVAAQVVAGQVDQHHMLGILFGILQEGFAECLVLYYVTTSAYGAGDRIDGGPSACDFAVGLGRGAKNPETAKIEIEE